MLCDICPNCSDLKKRNKCLTDELNELRQKTDTLNEVVSSLKCSSKAVKFRELLESKNEEIMLQPIVHEMQTYKGNWNDFCQNLWKSVHSFSNNGNLDANLPESIMELIPLISREFHSFASCYLCALDLEKQLSLFDSWKKPKFRAVTHFFPSKPRLFDAIELNNVLVAFCSDRRITVWNVCLESIVCTLHNPSLKLINLMQFIDHRLVVADLDFNVHLYNIHDQTRISWKKVHSRIINQILFHKETNQFVSCSSDNSIRIWNINTPQLKSRIHANQPFVAVCVNNNLLFAANYQSVRIYNFRTLVQQINVFFDDLRIFNTCIRSLSITPYPWILVYSEGAQHVLEFNGTKHKLDSNNEPKIINNLVCYLNKNLSFARLSPEYPFIHKIKSKKQEADFAVWLSSGKLLTFFSQKVTILSLT